jgi:hypothetical protein
MDSWEAFVRMNRILGAALVTVMSATAFPAVAQTTTDQMTDTRDDDGFDNWGLLGLLGLAGLMGRKRRDRDVVETRRV